MSISRHHSRHGDEEDESAFISMTDMTVSILFIVLILLAFFASQLRPEQTVPIHEYERVKSRLQERDLQLQEALKLIEDLTEGTVDVTVLSGLQEKVDRLTQKIAEMDESASRAVALQQEVAQLRDELARAYRLLSQSAANPLQVYNGAVAHERVRLLTTLRNQINNAFPELGVRISATQDALQFQGEGLFASGSASLSRRSQAKIKRIADLIDAALSCYTLGPRSAFDPSCNPSFAVIEALQIEGHTDSVGAAPRNVALSSQRAAATYAAMIQHESRLSDHQNLIGQPVLSVAGYGEDRPVSDNETEGGKSANRRIDLRFIMLRPARVEDIAKVQRALQGGVRE